MSHPFTITDEMIDDTLTTALEGGINYWAASAIPTFWPEAAPSRYGTEGMPSEIFASEVLTHGADLMITLDREAGGEVYRLTKAKMVKGMRAYCKLRKITPAAIEDDPVDAEGADVIVQLALFGEVVYG